MRNVNLIVLFFLLICSFNTIYAVSPGNSPSLPPDTKVHTLIPPMPADFADILKGGMVGISIGILLAALAYMIGNLLGMPQMLGWSKNQLWESVYTMVLVSTILVFSVVVHIFPYGVPEALQNTKYSFPEKAALSIDNVLHGKIDFSDLPPEEKKQLEELGFISTENMGIDSLFFTSYSFQIGLMVTHSLATLELSPTMFSLMRTVEKIGDKIGGDTTVGDTKEGGKGIFAENSIKFSGNFLPGLNKIAEFSGLITNYVFTLMLFLYAQLALLIFISGGSIFLFTFGVFFRCIPITRKLGSTLIALFITLYFVYPGFVLFVFSEDMYGEVNKEFAGIYVEENWLSGIEEMTPGITILSPFGLNQIKDDEPNEISNLTFYSFMFDEYNYSVKSDKEICKGTSKMGEVVSCDLGKHPSYSSLPDPNSKKFKEKLELYLIEEDKPNPAHKVVYTISLSQTNESGTFIFPDEPLEFNVFYVKACSEITCFQQMESFSRVLENNEQKRISSVLLKPYKDKFETGSQEARAADITSVAGKGAILGTVAYFGGFSKPGLMYALTALLFKNEIIGFTYDEVVCDPYTHMIATNYLSDSDIEVYPKSAWELDHQNKWYSGIADFFRGLFDFDFKKYFELLLKNTKDYYGESDYTSCSTGFGLVESGQVLSLAGSVLSHKGFDGWKWQNMNITVLLAPMVYVFISFIYTIIFCVTFFRSLSESIGGDSSLMGLGKLL